MRSLSLPRQRSQPPQSAREAAATALAVSRARRGAASAAAERAFFLGGGPGAGAGAGAGSTGALFSAYANDDALLAALGGAAAAVSPPSRSPYTGSRAALAGEQATRSERER